VEYDIILTIDILQGLRESIISNTPEFYVNIYTVDALNAILTKTNILENEQINEESNIQ
ncbi:17394_t:CDS:2, partial [Funneliformis geosporum]